MNDAKRKDAKSIRRPSLESNHHTYSFLGNPSGVVGFNFHQSPRRPMCVTYRHTAPLNILMSCLSRRKKSIETQPSYNDHPSRRPKPLLLRVFVFVLNLYQLFCWRHHPVARKRCRGAVCEQCVFGQPDNAMKECVALS